MKQKKKITKKRDFAKICKGAYCFGRDLGRDIGCDTSNCVTKSEKSEKKRKENNKWDKNKINVNNKITSPEQQCHRELNNVTASVTRDPKCAKIRKYWPREELGSST